ncbi:MULTISPECIES: substrate-binding domain-containing protein [unclassified Schaalia]|uniref:substrate-binding domain-containing protein n=1 Tax=unclassified Schaalia TaxID=2691889 RepID=UPI001E315B10|nr:MULTISPECIES: sugar-binding protein [unclassified Schaalia]MCD4550232.1 sugar-binding protein [Schaalia sp. lx-260]MCD4558148.1 sugar-binding protein [Schaalia sp. lx-100]
MKTWKNIAALGAAAALALTMSACGARNADTATSSEGATSGAMTGKVSIGIAMPQKTSQNWVEAEEIFKTSCAEASVDCQIQFANGGVAEQQNQISAMIENGVKVLVIGAIDGSQLGTQLAAAKAAGIKVIAYDRLLTNTTDLDYYIAYDNFGVGQLQGKALLDGLEAKGGNKPWNIEVFAGSPDDSNSLKFFNGAMDVLQPKVDDGTLVIKSGQSDFTQVATQGWLPKNAQDRMAALLTSTYQGDAVPAGVLSPNDTLGRAIITAIEQAGKSIPVVTGQDSEDESVTWVVQGRQYSTIFKDTRPLVKDAVSLAVALAQGNDNPKIEGATLDQTQYESKKGNPVKSFLLTPKIVTAENAADVYKNDEIRLKLVEKAQK